MLGESQIQCRWKNNVRVLTVSSQTLRNIFRVEDHETLTEVCKGNTEIKNICVSGCSTERGKTSHWGSGLCGQTRGTEGWIQNKGLGKMKAR